MSSLGKIPGASMPGVDSPSSLTPAAASSASTPASRMPAPDGFSRFPGLGAAPGMAGNSPAPQAHNRRVGGGRSPAQALGGALPNVVVTPPDGDAALHEKRVFSLKKTFMQGLALWKEEQPSLVAQDPQTRSDAVDLNLRGLHLLVEQHRSLLSDKTYASMNRQVIGALQDFEAATQSHDRDIAAASEAMRRDIDQGLAACVDAQAEVDAYSRSVLAQNKAAPRELGELSRKLVGEKHGMLARNFGELHQHLEQGRAKIDKRTYDELSLKLIFRQADLYGHVDGTPPQVPPRGAHGKSRA